MAQENHFDIMITGTVAADGTVAYPSGQFAESVSRHPPEANKEAIEFA